MKMHRQAAETQRRNRRTALLLGGMVGLMFGFGFAMVPLYNLLCQVTGTQSIALRTAAGKDRVTREGVDTARLVTVKFDTTVNPNLPWEFAPATSMLKVHPGRIYEVNFVARNRSSATVTSQAIPSVAPWQANPYFSKLECFCFQRQTLEGKASTEMPLRFMVTRQLPDEINSLTLSYSLMRLQPGQATDTEGETPPSIVAANE
jgi:cytochrome c oxidase assembly protein subunit 11